MLIVPAFILLFVSFGFVLDTATNKYSQYTDGIDLVDLVEEYPVFKDYFDKHSVELLAAFNKEDKTVDVKNDTMDKEEGVEL